MDIGPEEPAIIVEPMEVPNTTELPEPTETPVEAPVEVPAEVPA